MEPLVQFVNFRPLLLQLVGLQPADHCDALRVVGDGDVLQAAALGGGGHLLDARLAVGPRAVHVQIAADVVQLDERGQLAGVGPFKLVAGLTQLRRKTGQIERGIDLLFRATGNAIVTAKDAVLVDFQPARFRSAADDDVVLFRAGEVLQGRAERLGRHGAEIDLHACLQTQRGFRIAPGDDRSDAGEGRQSVHRRGDVCADDDKIEIADGLLAASITAGGNDLLDSPTTLHVANDFMHEFVGLDPKDSLPGFGGDFQPLQDGRLGLLPKTFEALNLVRLAGFAELVESGDFQIAIELCGPFRSEAGHAEDRQHALRGFRGANLRASAASRSDERCRLLGQILADALDVRERSVGIGHDVGHRFRQFRDCPGGVAIRAHAKGVRPLKLQQVGDFLENGGDFVVGHETRGQRSGGQGSEVRGQGSERCGCFPDP